jgi:Ca2+-binding RTX toxin-like protein
MTSPLGTGIVTPFNPTTGNALLDPLIVWGFKWGNGGVGVGTNVTYSFPTYNAVWHNDYAQYLDNEPFNGFTPFSAQQQTAAVAALATWAEVANITFQVLDDVPGDNDVGDIRFGNSNSVTQSPAVAWAYFPNDGGGGFQYPEAGDVWVDASYALNQQLNPGQFGFSTMVHEIGHALGLDHPFADAAGEPTLPAAMDNQRYTIMSYTNYSGATIEAYGPMLLDILAIQYLYGANMTTRATDTDYVFSNATEEFKCIWDAGGYDTFDLGNQTLAATIDLRAGQFSSIGIKNNGKAATGNIGIAYNVVIEEAIGGSGNDKITGNEADNKLTGGGGNDSIDGGAGADTIDGGIGADTMTGGLGDDLYRVDNAGDKVGEAQTNANGGGLDTVESQVSYSIAGYANVDNLTLLGSAVSGSGNSSDNTLLGNAQGNFLDGGLGADILKGGAGIDVYFIDNAGDVVDEEANADFGDEVRTGFLLAAGFAGIENYTYLGTAAWSFTGTATHNIITGGSGNDTLDGGAGIDGLLGNGGNDTLIGGTSDDWLDGGTGADKMFGGSGNDVYVVDNAGDTIDEEGNADINDTVRATVSVNLTTLGGGAIEQVLLLGAGAINATGNALVNTLTGNDGANILDGLGGADIMTGGLGSDTYTVDDAGDQVIETTAGVAGGTADTVKSAITFSIAALANIENLILTGVADIDGTGNAGANILTGNSGANRLDGGTGNDKMTGNEGNDTYVVDSAGDVIVESILNANNGGIDTVEVGFNFSLAALTNIDNLTLTGTAVSGTGNALANTILGNAQGNFLDGSLGADILKGGAGIDVYFIDNAGDVVDEEANADIGDEVRTSFLLAAGIAGIENYTYLGAAAWSFTGTATHNIISGGTGNDTLDGGAGIDGLLGNGGNDTLIGGTQEDWLDGGTGNDKMFGGSGNDVYVVDAAGDTIDEQGNADTKDLVRATVSVNLTTLGGGAIEQVLLLGAGAINATGNAGINTLTGNDGANALDGLGGADVMTGGLGSDTYTVDDAGDQVIETTAGATGGTDTVKSSVTYSLAALANVENLTLTGLADIDGTGNAAINILIGNSGANRLDGGTGNDKMTGNEGNDTYVVDSAGDVVTETILNANNGGVDTIEASLNYSIAALTNIDNLTLTGTAVSGTGNALANTILGNAQGNFLDGGLGADILKGGAGIDVYFIDNAGDVVDEEANADFGDEIRTSFLLAAGIAGIENYTYLGSAAWTFTGTATHNIISGGSGNDTLDGGAGIDGLLGNGGNDTLIGGTQEDWLDGGAGNDKMFGGSGNDVYVVDVAGDTIDEQGNADTGDTVRATVSVNLNTLGGGAIEHVLLLGAAAINATGNGSNNTLTGNTGANILDGGGGIDTLVGGIGADKLTGGSGRDTFDYNHLNEAGDTITDFVLGAAGDVLQLADLLDDIGYAGANPFADAVLNFAVSGANTLVRVDADGGGAGAAVTLVTLTNVILTQGDVDNYVV